MGHFICRFDVDGEARYLEWSTSVDAPITHGMTREAFGEYYREQHGHIAMFDLEKRLARADAYGTSDLREPPEPLAEFVKGNRAGANETELTLAELIDQYCRDPV